MNWAGRGNKVKNKKASNSMKKIWWSALAGALLEVEKDRERFGMDLQGYKNSDLESRSLVGAFVQSTQELNNCRKNPNHQLNRIFTTELLHD